MNKVLYHLQTGLSKCSLQFHIFSPFFLFLKVYVGQRGPAKWEAFSRPVNSTFRSQAQKFLLFMQKKDKQVPFMSDMPSWKCHSFVTKEQSMPGVCSLKSLLIQTKEKYSHLEGVIGRGQEWRKQSSDSKS